MNRRLRTLGQVSGVGLAVVCTIAPGGVGDDVHRPGTGGGAEKNTLNASATASNIQVTNVKGGGSGSKPLIPADPNWKPPACWYEPVATPEQLKDAVEGVKKSGGRTTVRVGAYTGWGEQLLVDHYEKGRDDGTGEPSWKNYNLGKDGKWWRAVVREDMEFSDESFKCDKFLFWQDAGTLPNDPNAPTPDVLAAYAYNEIKIPDTKVELKPDGPTKVNLPTWVWLDKAKFDDVVVRAELPGTGVWAETTAKPVSLHLDPGSGDARTYPASGECAINDDGSIGRPYRRGDAEKTPPCGVQYGRSSAGKSFPLKATVTWEITWEGSGGTGGDLPDGTFEGTQNVVVQEAQSVNR
ncbi:hypothetical protein HUT18_21695 [Streptomyces sp. NA04227]|uniref:hypothetical protein n=1 Tax=Streptomyces sp. NA04227 TaxID=2742136 RepID=UPI0015925BBB|nr:hypothetical protein [Streptomyces sp. NA04227]QKW08592.1 hypothetical protein HUT18_21695 [Streptomyces sp. NA04227]